MTEVGSKRPFVDTALVVSKKQKTSDNAVAIRGNDKTSLIPAGIQRTSNLEAPIMQLSGHEGEVNTTKFSPDGKSLASGSFDKRIFFWNVYGECENYNVLSGHKNAVLEVQYSNDADCLISVSADKTCIFWDLAANQQVRRFREHTSIVNSCHSGKEGTNLIVTGSDDSTVKVWDVRSKKSISTIKYGTPVTGVSFANDSDGVFASGLDNRIHRWDFLNQKEEYVLEGHTETVTSIALSPDGTHLLSNSMDNTVRVWDVKPYVSGGRAVRQYAGVQHNYECNLLKCSWSPDGKRIAAGSSDKFVYVWDVATGSLVYRLPGHKGAVTEVVFHPKEPIIASCSSDRTIYLGEIKPHGA